MKGKEIGVIKELRRNSRTSFTELGRVVDTPVSTIVKVIEKFRKKAVIKRYASLVDFAVLGFPLKSVFLIKTNQKGRVKEFLMNQDSLNTLYRLSGDYDFYAEHLFSDMASHTDFVDGLMELDVIKVSTHFLTGVKEEAFEIGVV